MEDSKITDLFWQRSEEAIDAVSEKYGKLCRGIAMNLLRNEEDAQECVNDTFYALWEAIPPHRPGKLLPFAAKITRNLAMKKLAYRSAEKRAVLTVPFEELNECIPGGTAAEHRLEQQELRRALEEFLGQLDPQSRNMFLRRYWFFDSVEEIARGFGVSAGSVKTRLYRIRMKLKQYLEQEVQVYVR